MGPLSPVFDRLEVVGSVFVPFDIIGSEFGPFCMFGSEFVLPWVVGLVDTLFWVSGSVCPYPSKSSQCQCPFCLPFSSLAVVPFRYPLSNFERHPRKPRRGCNLDFASLLTSTLEDVA